MAKTVSYVILFYLNSSLHSLFRHFLNYSYILNNNNNNNKSEGTWVLVVMKMKRQQ